MKLSNVQSRKFKLLSWSPEKLETVRSLLSLHSNYLMEGMREAGMPNCE